MAPQRSVQQVRSQLATARSQVQQQRQAVEGLQLRQLDPTEQRAQTRQQALKREQETKRLEQFKEKRLKELKPFESKVETAKTLFERSIENIRQNISEAKQKAFRLGALGISPEQQFEREIDKLIKVGLKPIFEPAPFGAETGTGKLKGFEDLIGKQSVSIEEAVKRFGLRVPELEIPGVKKELLEKLGVPTKLPFGIEEFKERKKVRPPPLVVGLPITPTEKVGILGKKFVRRVGEIIPKEEKGVIGLFGLEKEVRRPTLVTETPTITTDIVAAPGTGDRGTLIFTQREKTFFEKFGINPEDEDSINLKLKFDEIQSNFGSEVITEEQANKQLEAVTKDFTSKQIIKGVPSSAAFGVVFGLLQAIPFVGTGANILLGGDLLLKRDEVTEQFINFPVESALSTAAFITGGLVGAKAGAGIKGKVTDIKINPENLDSVTNIVGTEKTKLSNLALENFPEIVKIGKITDSLAYQVKLKDGTIFNVAEFTKLLRNGKLDKTFIGFEQAKTGEVFVGRGFGQIEGPKGKIFTRVIKFKPSPTRLGRFVQRRFGSGRIIDIVEKVKLGGVKRVREGVTVAQVESVAGILKTSKAKADVIRDISNLVKDIKQGKKISMLKLRRIVNIDRVLSNRKPFTEAEFRGTNIRALTDTQLASILDKVKIGFQKKFPKLEFLPGLKRVSLLKKEIIAGKAITRGVEIFPKRPFPRKTPLEVTFAKEAPIVTRAKELARSKPFSRLKGLIVKKPKTKQQIVRSPSGINAAALAALTKLDQTRIGVGTFFGGPLALGFVLSPQGIQSSLVSNKNRIDLIQKNLVRLDNLAKQGIVNVLTVKTLSDQREVLLVKQKVLLDIKQQLDTKLKRKLTEEGVQITVTPTIKPTTPTILIPKILTSEAAKKRKLARERARKEGYNTFVKSRGKFRKVNVVPRTKKESYNLGSWLTDRTTSRTFKIKRSKRNAQQPKLKVPRDYWLFTKRKFRGKIRKGVQQPLKNLGIEKSKFLIDTLGEKKQLSLARERAKLLKKSKKLPPPKLKFTSMFKLRRKKK